MQGLRGSFRAALWTPRTLRSRPLPNAARCASTARQATPVFRTRNAIYGASTLVFLAFGYLYATDTRSSYHSWLVVPVFRYLYPDAEEAHHIGTKTLALLYKLGLNPRERPSVSGNASQTPSLRSRLWEYTIDNPVSISAGLDKLAEIPDALFALGPGIVEVGGCTPKPQEGNPKPRVFRLPSVNGFINRYGLNSYGADDMARRLRERVRLFARAQGLGADAEGEQAVLDGEAGVPPGSLHTGRLLMVQVAKNKDTDGADIEAVRQDYVYCVERLARYADVLVVNVSSPNTPGLRTLQNVEPLSRILEGVVKAAQGCDRKTKPRVMVKVSPDEDSDAQIEGIAEAVWRSGVDGVIVGNTTNRRSDLLPPHTTMSPKDQQTLLETGGYSGPQMYNRTLALVKRYNQFLNQGSSSEKFGSQQAKVIFATGGITTGRQVGELLDAGASIAQIYTGLVYGGSGTITRMKRELQARIIESKAN